MTPAWLRPPAEADLIERTHCYATEPGRDVAGRFFDAALAALRAIERVPGTGSPRRAERCDIPGLRMRRVEGFASGRFYSGRTDHHDVIRLLADAKDLAASLGALDDQQ